MTTSQTTQKLIDDGGKQGLNSSDEEETTQPPVPPIPPPPAVRKTFILSPRSFQQLNKIKVTLNEVRFNVDATLWHCIGVDTTSF